MSINNVTYHLLDLSGQQGPPDVLALQIPPLLPSIAKGKQYKGVAVHQHVDGGELLGSVLYFVSSPSLI